MLIDIEKKKKSKEIDPYCCAIKTVGDFKTVGHTPQEVSRHFYFYLREEGGRVDGSVLSTAYRPSPIPNGGLEIPLTLTFRSPTFITHQKMKEFITKLYCYDDEPVVTTEDPEEEIQIDLDIEVGRKSNKRMVIHSSEEDGGWGGGWRGGPWSNWCVCVCVCVGWGWRGCLGVRGGGGR